MRVKINLERATGESRKFDRPKIHRRRFSYRGKITRRIFHVTFTDSYFPTKEKNMIVRVFLISIRQFHLISRNFDFSHFQHTWRAKLVIFSRFFKRNLIFKQLSFLENQTFNLDFSRFFMSWAAEIVNFRGF